MINNLGVSETHLLDLYLFILFIPSLPLVSLLLPFPLFLYLSILDPQRGGVEWGVTLSRSTPSPRFSLSVSLCPAFSGISETLTQTFLGHKLQEEV